MKSPKPFFRATLNKSSQRPALGPAYIVICDLDGTLYNSAGRERLAEAKLWSAFHSASAADPPNMDVLNALHALAANEAEIIAITGRDEQFRGITIDWFTRNLVPIETVLMRPDLDWRPDKVVKIELLESWLLKNGRDKDEIAFALEDRDRMVAAWREYGIPCWQVRAGAF